METCSPEGCMVAKPPSIREPSARGGSIRFLMRTLANVPRIITSWLPRRIEAAGALAPLVDEPGRLEHCQVLGDGRPGHVEPRRDVAGGQLAVPHEAEDLAT